MTDKAYSFEVKRDDLRTNRIIELPPAADIALADGEVLLTVDEFALTANNVTYGVAGDLLGYWQFFPAEGEYGRIPVWACARVLRSKAGGVDEGERFYGYFPMSSYLKVQASEHALS